MVSFDQIVRIVVLLDIVCACCFDPLWIISSAYRNRMIQMVFRLAHGFEL